MAHFPMFFVFFFFFEGWSMTVDPFCFLEKTFCLLCILQLSCSECWILMISSHNLCKWRVGHNSKCLPPHQTDHSKLETDD